jgi:hypothetical protein
LSSIPDGISSFKRPEDGKGKGSGKKGDEANPTDHSKPKDGTGKGPNGTGASFSKKKRSIRPGQEVRRMGQARNTLQNLKCVADVTVTEEMVITSLR